MSTPTLASGRPEAEPRSEWDVFLSHATEDSPWCEALATKLRDAGVRVWFDAWQLQPGDHPFSRINDGLRRSRKMVPVWGEAEEAVCADPAMKFRLERLITEAREKIRFLGGGR